MKNICCHCGFKKEIFKQVKNEDNKKDNICKDCYMELLGDKDI